MPSAKLEALVAELDAALATIGPEYEGFQDFRRLNLAGESNGVLDQEIEFYRERIELIGKAKQALQNLVADGYPDMPKLQVTGTVFSDLLGNKNTIEAAFARVEAIEEATSANISAGTPEPK